MTKVMFSIHVGDSMVRVLRTRRVARYLLSRGYDVLLSVPRKALPFLRGYVDKKHVCFNNQSYSFRRLPGYVDLSDRFYRHAAKEAETYHRYKPDILIGEPGLLAFSYRPEVPFLRIMNRCYLELHHDNMDSSFSLAERSLMKAQFEDVVNQNRRLLGIIEDFEYSQYVQPPAIVLGASYFVGDCNPAHLFVGVPMEIDLTLRGGEASEPSYRKCFATFGTGLAGHRVGLVSAVLEFIEPRFDELYISYGLRIDGSDLYQPANAVMKPLFNELPSDIGVLICHGGYGTVHLGIDLGVPMIAIPFQLEQYSNAYRAEKLGVGVNAGTYSKAQFRGIYETVQIDWSIFKNALANLESIRTTRSLRDELESDETTLQEAVEEFILSNA